MVKKHFIPIDHCGQSSSANYLRSKEWEFGGSVSVLVRGEQGMGGGDQGEILSMSYVEEWFFVVSSLLEHKKVEYFLIFSVF